MTCLLLGAALAGCNSDGEPPPPVYPPNDLSVVVDLLVGADLAVPPDLADVPPPRCKDTSGLQRGAPWPMAGQCPTRQGRSPLLGPGAPMLRWQISVWQDGGASTLRGSPVVGADETVYFASTGMQVRAVDGRSGAVKWTTPLAAMPVLGARDLVVVGSMGGIGRVRGLDPATGQVRWQAGPWLQVDDGVTPGPGGVLYFVDGDSLLHALSDRDGSEAWSTRVSAIGEQTASAPTQTDDGVLVGTRDRTAPLHLLAVTAAGKTGWQASKPMLLGAPVVDNSSAFAMTTDGLVAFDLGGAQRWSRSSDGAASFPPAIGADGVVFLAAEHDVHALDPASGAVRWTFATGALVTTAPVVDAGGTVYVGTFDHKVWALDGRTGKQRWSYLAGAGIVGALALGNGSLYFGAADGNVQAIGP